jgi:L-rhamnose mutarotase
VEYEEEGKESEDCRMTVDDFASVDETLEFITELFTQEPVPTSSLSQSASGRAALCFQQQVDPAKLAEYVEVHKRVWHEMQEEVVKCGRRNFQLFYRPDGLVIGYYESDQNYATHQDAIAVMKRTEGYNRWQEMCKEYHVDKDRRFDENMSDLILTLRNSSIQDSATKLMDEASTVDTNTMDTDAPWSPQEFTGGGMLTKAGRRPVCFQMHFDPNERMAFVEAHTHLWREMQQALVDCGWHNFSLFHKPDGLAIGYYESDHATHENGVKALKKMEMDVRWEEAMKKFALSNKPRGVDEELLVTLSQCCFIARP